MSVSASLQCGMKCFSDFLVRIPRESRIPLTIFRTLRLAAGFSLQELAARIGLSHQQLQKYETGSNRPGAGLLPGFAEALGVDVATFFEDADAPPPAGVRRSSKSEVSAEAGSGGPIQRTDCSAC